MFPNAIFGFIHLYGLMIGAGILSAFGVLFLYGKRLSIDIKFMDFLFYNGIVSIAFGFLSASLFQTVYNYIKNPGEGFRFGGGMTFLGGLIGGVVCFPFLLFALCSVLLLKKYYRHNMSLYLISYGVFRFLIEFLRGDDRGRLFGKISPSQFWSLIMVIAGLILYCIMRYMDGKSNEKII